MESTKMEYSAGWNMPGYFPSVTERFPTFDEAHRFIIDELKRQEDGAPSEDEAEIYCHEAEDVNLESGPFESREMPDGNVYWVDFVLAEDTEESGPE